MRRCILTSDTGNFLMFRNTESGLNPSCRFEIYLPLSV